MYFRWICIFESWGKWHSESRIHTRTLIFAGCFRNALSQEQFQSASSCECCSLQSFRAMLTWRSFLSVNSCTTIHFKSVRFTRDPCLITRNNRHVSGRQHQRASNHRRASIFNAIQLQTLHGAVTFQNKTQSSASGCLTQHAYLGIRTNLSHFCAGQQDTEANDTVLRHTTPSLVETIYPLQHFSVLLK